METTTLPAVNINELQKIVGEAPAILEKNTTSLAKAKEAGEKLFSLVEKDGMSDLYDGELAKYNDKLKTTLKNMNEGRKPFTQLVDRFKKMFTEAEADLKPLQDKAQKLRDDYATKKMNEQRERERLAQLKLNQDKERIEMKKKIVIMLSDSSSELIRKAKQSLSNTLEGSTLETLELSRKTISDAATSLDRSLFDRIETRVTPLYLTAEDVKLITVEAKDEAYIEESGKYQSELVSYKRELIDKIPSKKKELEELSIAKGEAAKKLHEEAVKRKAEEAKRLAKEGEESKRKSEELANLKATADTTNAMVSNQAELFTEAPKVKEGYEIILKNTAAYLVLAQFWFDREGKTWNTDKLEKMTLGRIKKFCEEYASKKDEKIESPFIEYKEIFKAK